MFRLLRTSHWRRLPYPQRRNTRANRRMVFLSSRTLLAFRYCRVSLLIYAVFSFLLNRNTLVFRNTLFFGSILLLVHLLTGTSLLYFLPRALS